MRKPFFWKSRKTWYVRVDAGDGKLTAVNLGPDRKKAHDAWAEMLRSAQADAGWIKRPVVDLIELFIADQLARRERGELSELLVQFRMGRLAAFREFIGGDMTADQLKPHHVLAWLDTQTTWGPTSRYEGAAAVKATMRWAVRVGHIASHHIDALSVPKGGRRDYVISAETYAAMLGGWKVMRAEAKAFRDVLVALWHTGCRPGEIIAVDIEHVAKDHTTWSLPNHKTAKKTKRPRIVYLSPEMQQMTQKLIAGRNSGPLFVMGNGNRWEYPIMRRAFHRLRERANIDRECVLYSFRHTWITQSLTSGVDIATVATMAGTSIQMIDRHYGHLARQHDHLMKAAATIAAAMPSTAVA